MKAPSRTCSAAASPAPLLDACCAAGTPTCEEHDAGSIQRRAVTSFVSAARVRRGAEGPNHSYTVDWDSVVCTAGELQAQPHGRAAAELEPHTTAHRRSIHPGIAIARLLVDISRCPVSDAGEKAVQISWWISQAPLHVRVGGLTVRLVRPNQDLLQLAPVFAGEGHVISARGNRLNEVVDASFAAPCPVARPTQNWHQLVRAVAPEKEQQVQWLPELDVQWPSRASLSQTE